MVERSYSRSYITTNYSIPRSASTWVVAAPVTLARSSTTVFTDSPRMYHPFSSYTPPISPRLGVVGRTPHYSDRYPFVRYSSGYSPGPYASPYSSHGALTDTTTRHHYTQRSSSPLQYLNSNLNLYQSNLRTSPSYGSSPLYGSSSYSYNTSRRMHVPKLNVDNAVDMYKKRYLSGAVLSKYWLTPKYWENRREKEKRVSSAISNTGYANAYTSRYIY